jgi:hypothetical protein
LIVSAILVSTPVLRAQIAHTDVSDCGCHSCQPTCHQGCECESCCSGCGLIGGLTARLGGLLIGGDGRHHIYKAALCRNSFDKKFLMPIAYYSHILPIYRKNRCCSGPVTHAGHCPTCGPHEVMEGEVIEMQQAPVPAPTPASVQSQPILPGTVVTPRVHQPRTPKTHDRVAQHESTEGYTPLVLRREPRKSTQAPVQPASAVERRPVREVPNPLR